MTKNSKKRPTKTATSLVPTFPVTQSENSLKQESVREQCRQTTSSENSSSTPLSPTQKSDTQSFSGQKVLVPIGRHGVAIGEFSASARYTDNEIDLVLQLRESGMSLGEISKTMDMPKSTVHSICQGRQRACVPTGWARRKIK